MMETAQDIYQHHLDQASRALWDRDWSRNGEFWRFPLVARGSDGTGTEVDEAEVIRHGQAFRDRMAGLGATAYHRVCLDAAYGPGDPDRIVGRHRTYILRGGNYLVPPYDCDMVLHRAPAVWIASSLEVSGGLSNLDPTTRALAMPPGAGRHAAVQTLIPCEDAS